MGVVTLSVDAAVAATKVYSVTEEISNNCYSEREITVLAASTVATYASGLHVQIKSIGIGANMDIEETITTDKTYTLYIGGSKNTSDGSAVFISDVDTAGTTENPQSFTYVSAIKVVIRDETINGTVLASLTLRRTHTADFC